MCNRLVSKLFCFCAHCIHYIVFNPVFTHLYSEKNCRKIFTLCQSYIQAVIADLCLSQAARCLEGLSETTITVNPLDERLLRGPKLALQQIPPHTHFHIIGMRSASSHTYGRECSQAASQQRCLKTGYCGHLSGYA